MAKSDHRSRKVEEIDWRDLDVLEDIQRLEQYGELPQAMALVKMSVKWHDCFSLFL